MQRFIETQFGKSIKSLNKKLFITLSLIILSCCIQANEYSLTKDVYDAKNKYFGKVNYKMEDMNNDGIKEAIYDLTSFIHTNKKKITPKDCNSFMVFEYSTYYIIIVDFGARIYSMIIDSEKKLIGQFENMSEIRNWTKAYTGIDDDNAWMIKYNLGYYFKDLSIKSNKIFLLTNDGGSGSTGGFNIEHVFTITNGKPVTLVSRFVPNPEKEKAIKAMQDRMK